MEGELFGVVGQWLLLLLLLSRAAGGEGAVCSGLLLREAGDGAHGRGE